MHDVTLASDGPAERCPTKVTRCSGPNIQNDMRWHEYHHEVILHRFLVRIRHRSRYPRHIEAEDRAITLRD